MKLQGAIAAGLVLIAVALPANVSAQATITGRVTDQTGGALISASIFITGTGVGAISGAGGRYTLTVPAGRFQANQTVEVEASLIGYQQGRAQVTLTTGGTATADFVLVLDPLRLEQIVATGAGTSARAERIGNQRASVNAQDIARANEGNVIQALAGKVPNVITNQQAGDPGASVSIQIRGTKTLGTTSQPLIILDGVPINNATRAIGRTGGANPGGSLLAGAVTPNRGIDINPDDIESVEILKGAAATSIYGAAAGSGGAILITTKRGRPGSTAYTLRSSFQRDEPIQTLPYQTRYGIGSNGVSSQCTALNCTIASNFQSWGPELPAGTPVYNQGELIYETGAVFDNTLSMSGGNDRTTFYVSAGGMNHSGFIYGDSDFFDRYSFRFNGSHAVFDNLTIGASGSYVQTKGGGFPRGNAIGGLLGALRQPPEFNAREYLSPTSGLHRSWRFPNPGPTAFTNSRGFDNPYYILAEALYRAETGRYFGNVTANWAALDWLTLNYTLGADYNSDDRTEALPISATGTGGGQLERWQFYDRIIDHNLTATAEFDISPNMPASFTVGQNLNETYFRQVNVFAQTWIAPLPFKLSNTVTRPQPPTDSETRARTEGYYAQGTVDINQQLFLMARVRNDGNSAFGEGHQRAWYPGGSAAWSFSRAFQLPDFIDFGRVRLAYGEVGLQPPVYATQDVFTNAAIADFNPGSQLITTLGGIGGLYPSTIKGTRDIRPERVKELEFGVDLTLFDTKADLGLTRYQSHSYDVIFSVDIPPSTGYSSVTVNAAEIENKGWEATFNVRPVQREGLTVELGTSWAMNRNEVLSLGNPDATAESCTSLAVLPRCETGVSSSFGGQSTHAQVGYPFGVWRGSDFARCGRGLTTIGSNNIEAACAGAPDGALYIAADGYPIQDLNTRVIGDPEADWTAGLSASVTYKGLNLSAFVDHRQGGDVLNMTRASMYQYGTHGDTNHRGEMRTFGQDWLCQNRTCDLFNGPVVGPGAGTAVLLGQSWFTGLGSIAGPPTNRIEDATNTRLREISVGYSFTNEGLGRFAGLRQIDLKLSGRNLALWTDYSGFDPETNLAGAAASNRGIDWFNNPLARAWVLSVALHH
jgi:TonB-linked SusC/RagA family outer membrane protein